ncbi:copper amine oxidase [Cohnella suwonensis]|uniref:Copper amine oxidase n=1 Tax=Cohnella suwonensis TaxID=696072 RepID=A0ABW0LMV5_9BACL
MKVRKLVLLTLAFSLIWGSVAYADTATQKLRLWINKKSESTGVVSIDNKTYVSTEAISERLQGIVINDDNKVDIYKPNVHMLTSYRDGTIFGDVPKDKKLKFNTFIQVDSLKVDINALKLTIADPYDEETLIESRKLGDSDFPDKEAFWITMKDISYSFDSAGPYKIRFWVKPVGETSYQVVSEKVINSK